MNPKSRTIIAVLAASALAILLWQFLRVNLHPDFNGTNDAVGGGPPQS
jgi:hypothetical protein